MLFKTTVAAACLGLAAAAVATYRPQVDADVREQAASILEVAGVGKGLIVHLGCGNGRLTAALHQHEGCIVHGLDADPAHIAEAREYIRSLGIYGEVSAECWTGPHLPYVDHSVNLLVGETPGAVSAEEMTRVLVPGGVAYVRQGDDWTKTVKRPRPDVDEWTHFLHDASGNAVAHDQVVGPPRHLQWTAEPRHGRSHEFTPSIQALVSSGGRIFYVADQGSTATLRQPAEWKLVARDAHNGLLLWERSLGEWFPLIYGWTQGPLQLQRKLVAVGNCVYATLGFHAPLSALNAANGETLRVYQDTEGAEEILWHRGILLLVAKEVTAERRAAFEKLQRLTAEPHSPLQLRDSRTPFVNSFRNTENSAGRTILAIEASSGQVLWKKSGDGTEGLQQLSLRACGDRVYYQRQASTHCLELASGKSVWTAAAGPLRAVSEDSVVCVSRNSVTRLSPVDGQPQWTGATTLVDIRDVLLVGDSLWLGGGKPYDTGNAKHTGPGWGPYFAQEYNLATGQFVKEITAENPKHHHRCYDNKATDRYLLGGRRGTEFLDLQTGDYLWHSWARGTCRYGVMPCNGMLYVPPHACGCYVTVKLMGFNALAPARDAQPAAADNLASRLEKGPAYESVRIADASAPAAAEWPTFRGDTRRSANARCAVPTDVAIKWQSDVGGTVTPPVVADGKAFVARPEQHEVLAIDQRTGKTAWTYTAGGRIDSPPTVFRGLVHFGCRDGYAYGLRAADGVLAWRFQAARDPRRIVAGGQLESASPLHGSVLVHDGTLWLTAGRSSYLDGGIDLYRLDPLTGQALSRTQLYSPDSETGQQPEQFGPASMPGARSDILAADGSFVYLRDLTFNRDGAEVQERAPHLFTLTDYLDDSGPHRSYWICGTQPSIATGCSSRDRALLYGRLLAFDDSTVYGYGRETVHWSSEFEDGEYRLFARKKDADKPQWARYVPVHLRALLLAGDVLFAAGAGPAPSRFPEKLSASDTPRLLAISAVDGNQLAELRLPASVVFNGMSAARGELLLTLEDGQLLCLAKK